ncbi:MAG: histidine phosphatase family protein [Gammaproteobacteria bacterium]
MLKLFSKRTFSSISFMRHAKSAGNESGIVQGSSPNPKFGLSKAGRLSVQPALAHIPKPTILVVSGLPRTIQTAEAWFGLPFAQIPIQTRIERDFLEINAGEYEEKFIADIKEDTLWKQWMSRDPLKFPGFPGGENLSIFADRIVKAGANLCAEYGDSKHRVCVITHGVAMRVLKCFLAGQGFDHIWSHKVENLERIDLTAAQIKKFQAHHEEFIQPNLHTPLPSLSKRSPQ